MSYTPIHYSFDRLGRPFYDREHKLFFSKSKGLEHVLAHVSPGLRPADSYFDASEIIRAEAGTNGINSEVTTRPSTALDPQPPERQIYIVLNHHKVPCDQIEDVTDLASRFSATIHVSLRLHQTHSMPPP